MKALIEEKKKLQNNHISAISKIKKWAVRFKKPKNTASFSLIHYSEVTLNVDTKDASSSVPLCDV